jgi:hypothetical protein
MKSILIFSVLLILSDSALAADAKVQSIEIGKPHMEFDCYGRKRLRLYIRSGEIRLVGSDGGKISVDLSGKNADKIEEVKARFSCQESSAELHITGGPKDELRITVHVPKNVDLFARIPAGSVIVEDITGNKDVELHAGELTIYVGKPSEYGHVSASVYAGEVDAEAFGDNKGGLFRSVSRDNGGPYELHAHVGSGQLTLR